ncbi:MAG: hypothetical protein R2698_03145 [Microthrixaceae bacterium]
MALDVHANGARRTGTGGPPSRVARNLVLGLIALSFVGGWAGDIFLSFLIPEHPAVLLALSDRLRNYPLLAAHTDPATYYGIGLARLVFAYPLFFLLGRWYGDAAVEWVGRWSPTLGDLFVRLARWFDRAPDILVAFVHINAVSVFAGASSISTRRYLCAKVTGSAVVLVAFRLLADQARGVLGVLGEWIGSHRPLMVLVAVAGLAVLFRWERRSGGRSTLGHLAHVEDELETSVRTAPRRESSGR